MKVSARNAFQGTITAIQPGAINSEVTLKTSGGDTLVAIVTAGSVQSLGLSAGLTFSARNQLVGQVSTLIKGAVNTEVGVTLPGGTEVFSVVTNEAVAELNLAVGKPASAIIKASHVILAVPT
jgi:molybdate transport system regulatory protein